MSTSDPLPALYKAVTVQQNPTPTFTLTDLPLPPLGPFDILVKLSATSVCGTDLALATGTLGPCRPVLGHEGVGRVAKVGSHVQTGQLRSKSLGQRQFQAQTQGQGQSQSQSQSQISGEGAGRGVSIGQRVGVSWVRETCGDCAFCLRGGAGEVRCARKIFSGKEVDGTFAQFTVVSERAVIRLPDDSDFIEGGEDGDGDNREGRAEKEEEARSKLGQRPNRTPTPSDAELAPIMCAGVSAYKALKDCGATPGAWVAVSGAGGGVGALGVQYARAMGYRVVAVDAGEGKKSYCMRLGAEVYIDVQAYRTGQEVADAAKRATENQGVEAAVVCAGSAQAYQDALGMLAPFGTLVCVGIPPPSKAVQFHPLMFIDRGIRLIGSMVGSKGDIYEAVRFVQRGLVKPEVTVVGMEELGQVMKLLASGETTTKYVIKLD